MTHTLDASLLVKLFVALLSLGDAVVVQVLRGGPTAASQAIEIPDVHTVLATGSSQTQVNEASVSNSSSRGHARANVQSNGSSYPFSVHSLQPGIGKVFALYYSTASGQKVTEIEAREYQVLSRAPEDPAVFNPVTGQQVERGHCKLRLTSHTTVASDWRKYNLRLAEIAVCQMFIDSPCESSAEGCELEIFAPLPYSYDQEPYLAAGMALVAHSALCAKRVEAAGEAWKRSQCEIVRNRGAIAAGLQMSSDGIILSPIPGEWVDLKLDATHELGFQEASLAVQNENDYHHSTNYKTKDDVLKWQRAPPRVHFCERLNCLVDKYETR